MSRNFARAGLGALALFVFASVVHVSTAGAQWASAAPTTTGTTSTTCGAGTLSLCGSTPITECTVKWTVNVNIFSRSFGVSYEEKSCEVIGSTPIYKDIQKETATVVPCTSFSVFKSVDGTTCYP